MAAERAGTSSSGTTLRNTTGDDGADKDPKNAINNVANRSSSGGDRLLGECSLNLVGVVSGRAPHVEEWVPLDTEGDLRLSLDYDSVGPLPVPGDSVRPPRRFFVYGGVFHNFCRRFFFLRASVCLGTFAANGHWEIVGDGATGRTPWKTRSQMLECSRVLRCVAVIVSFAWRLCFCCFVVLF